MMTMEKSSQASAPLVSIIVTIVDGKEVLERFLHAVTAQEDPPALEIIVPYDESVNDTKGFSATFPEVNFLPLGVIKPENSIHTAAGQHELYDRRRAAGLAAATGDIITILEDRGIPRSDWAKTLVRLHEQPYGVIGGAIECEEPCSLLNWSFYVCDFSRYGLPFESGPVSWVSDVNVSYKRPMLEQTRSLWKDRFSEPVVHWSLLEAGETLYLSSDLVVEHCRPKTSLAVLLPERFDWGRLFGHIRAMHLPARQRYTYILISPLIPPMLLLRHALTQYRKGRLGRYIKAIPLTFILLLFWTAGEAWGNLTKKA